MSSQVSPYPVRMNPELRAWIEAQAEANHRSINGEIVARLDQQYQAEQRKSRRQQTQGGRSHD